MPVAVAKVLEYIDKHLSDEITINAMSAELHYSSDHLSRAFSEATGDSLKHYINAKKIALAQKLLLENNSPYDVCFMVGYNNYSSFSRRFSNQIGVSPKQYQLSNRVGYDKEVNIWFVLFHPQCRSFCRSRSSPDLSTLWHWQAEGRTFLLPCRRQLRGSHP